ncbi:hypothetical protein [uncultured Paludibaculum sp.]|uniref:hypothetical protein n=1 Tax=uncultured Paludibaculum sp. TaxID=1765020 RepID=UPI002AAB2617|nr:hypothetical protein [uncultured Paludibaculum sp.]
MPKFIAILITALAVFAADDAWTKVRALKGGAELRIVRKDVRQPILAKMDELTDSSLVVVVKNEQVAIPRDEIERIDARPQQSGSRMTKETKVGRQDEPSRDVASPKPGRDGGPSNSSSSSVAFGSKPDFETVYRSLAPPPAKK